MKYAVRVLRRSMNQPEPKHVTYNTEAESKEEAMKKVELYLKRNGGIVLAFYSAEVKKNQDIGKVV